MCHTDGAMILGKRLRYERVGVLVPSLRGRIVPADWKLKSLRIGPVPTGTDCSLTRFTAISAEESRPYGDGLFQIPVNHLIRIAVPSLRGRIVPDPCKSSHPYRSPVPTGTDCSGKRQTVCRKVVSRSYGDGLFCVRFSQILPHFVPSLRGRIVLTSVSFGIVSLWSRPYGDGLFLMAAFKDLFIVFLRLQS